MASAKKTANALVGLADLLSESDAAVRAQVRSALEEPDAYVEKYAKRLGERAITKPRPDLAWIALIDALASKKRLAEIDHATFADDAAGQLGKLATLPKKRGRFDWIDELEDADDLSTEDFLGMTEKLLAKEKLTLVMLDMRSDAFPIVVVPRKDAAKISKLAKDAGYEAKKIEPSEGPASPEDEAEDEDEAPEWRVFVRGQDTWALKVGATQLITETGPIGGASKMRSESVGSGKTAAEAKKRVAEKLAEGFAEVSASEYERLEAQAKKKR